MKIKKLQYIYFISTLFILLFGCSSGPNDNEIIKTIYKQQFSPGNTGLQLLLNINVLSTGTSKKQGDIKFFPVTAKINYIQGGLEMGYTGQGPGKYAQEYEVEVIRDILFYKDNNDKWQISSFKDRERKEFEKVWRPGNRSMNDFYKDKVKFNLNNLDK